MNSLYGICSVWDIRNGQLIKTLDTDKIVTSLEVVNDDLLITADGTSVKFWDANSFEVIKQFDTQYQVYSPDKRKFATGGEDMWIHLHDFESGEEIDTNKGKNTR